MKSIEALISDMIHAIESIESYHVSSFEAFLDDEKNTGRNHVQRNHLGRSDQ
jgi:uncharacterized protein with HEPN domain